MDLAGIRATLARGGAFLVIGGIAFVVDAALYNLLVFIPGGRGVLFDLPILAKILAIVVASLVTYVGNRFWTFRRRALTRRISRYVIFAVVNLIAMGLQLGCLAFSRYVLGLDDPVADNIAGTLVGQAVATLFRYVAYEKVVFRGEKELSAEVAAATIS